MDEGWTPESLWDKADWEGGIAGLIEYGGSEIFRCLGYEAVLAAREVEKNMRILQNIFNAVEDARIISEEDEER